MAINIFEALDKISNLDIKSDSEIINIEDSLNKICSKDIFSTSVLPKFDNSAMDGYAIRYEDRQNELKLIDTILAGDNNQRLLEENTCIKVMTGAMIPHNTSAVIPKEDTLVFEDKIKITQGVKKNQHIKYIGEDIGENQLLIKKGEEINFAKITLLASQGISHIEVYKKPKITVFSSGEELKPYYESIQDYQIYNSNTPTFLARAKELACDTSFVGQARDSIESICSIIENSLDSQLIISSGGVSVGDADFTKEAFLKFDFQTIFDGIVIKPGKPTVFGKINNTYVLNLPGNPLAAALIFEVFGKLIIQKLLGAKQIHHNYIVGKLKDDFRTKKGKITIIPGLFDGEFFHISEKRSPGMVNVLSSCNSMIVINDDIEILKKDSILKILPINWKFFTKKKKDFIIYE